MAKRREHPHRRRPTDRPKQAKPVPERWQIAVYEKADKTRPALAFLQEIPKEPRRELLKAIVAVVQVGPLRFPTGTPAWRLMRRSKKKGQVDMSGIFEARDKHAKLLYRVYCVIDGDAPSHGLFLPSVVLVGGAVKPVREEVPQATYRRVDANRRDYWKTRRVARLKKPPSWWPQSG